MKRFPALDPMLKGYLTPEHLLCFLDCYPLGVVITYDRRIIFANKFMTKLTGYTLDELIGKTTRIFFFEEEEWEKVGQRMQEELEKGTTKMSIQRDFKRKDGTVFRARIVMVPVQKIKDKWLVVSSVEDITFEEDITPLEEKDLSPKDKTQIEQIKKKKAFLSDIIESLPFGIVIFQGGKIFYKNKLFDNYFPEKIPENIFKLMQENSDEPEDKIRQLETKNGKIFALKVASIGNKFKMLIIQDVSCLAKINKELNGYICSKVEEELAKERLVFMGKILAEIVHEINTPVSFMKTNIQVFSAYLDTLTKILQQFDFPKKEQKIINKIIEESEDIANSLKYGVERIAQLVRSVKTMSKQKEEQKDIDLTEALAEALALTFNRTKKIMKIYVNRKIYKFNQLKLNKKYMIRANKAGLVQMFVIVINNALEVARERRVLDAQLKIEIKDRENLIEVNFIDNCGGVNEEEIKKVVDQFYTTKRGGTGLGLYILKELSKSMKAQVELKNNQESQGFQVSFSFAKRPLTEAEIFSFRGLANR